MIKTFAAAVALLGVPALVVGGTNEHHHVLRGLEWDEDNNPFDGGIRLLQSKVKCVCQNSTKEIDDCANSGYTYTLTNSNIIVDGNSSFEYTLTKCASSKARKTIHFFEIYPPRDVCPSPSIKVIEGKCSCVSNDTAKCKINSPDFSNTSTCDSGVRAAACSNIKTLASGESVVLKFNVSGVNGLGASRIYSNFGDATCGQLCISGPTCKAVVISDLEVECIDSASRHHKVSYNITSGRPPFETTVYCGRRPARVLNGTASPSDPAIGLNTLQIEPCPYYVTVRVQDASYCPGMKLISAPDQHSCQQQNDCVPVCKLSQNATEIVGCDLTSVPTFFTNKNDVYNFSGDCNSNLELIHKVDEYSPNPLNFCPPNGVTVSRQYFLALSGDAISRTQCNQSFVVVQKALPTFVGTCENVSRFKPIKIGCKGTTIPDPYDCQYHTACSNETLNATYSCCFKNGMLHRKWTAKDTCNNTAIRTQDVKFAGLACS